MLQFMSKLFGSSSSVLSTLFYESWPVWACRSNPSNRHLYSCHASPHNSRVLHGEAMRSPLLSIPLSWHVNHDPLLLPIPAADTAVDPRHHLPFYNHSPQRYVKMVESFAFFSCSYLLKHTRASVSSETLSCSRSRDDSRWPQHSRRVKGRRQHTRARSLREYNEQQHPLDSCDGRSNENVQR